MDEWDGEIFIYFTSPATSQRHLAKADELYQFADPKTLCGLRTDGLTEGDESLSGWRATCGICKSGGKG